MIKDFNSRIILGVKPVNENSGDSDIEEEVTEWIERARKDLDDAEFNIENRREAPGVVFLQQAIEKALKAKIIIDGEEPDFTHNLMKLANDAELPKDKRKYFPQLTNLYTGVRYPGEELSDIENLDEMLGSTKEVLEWIEKRLKQ